MMEHESEIEKDRKLKISIYFEHNNLRRDQFIYPYSLLRTLGTPNSFESLFSARSRLLSSTSSQLFFCKINESISFFAVCEHPANSCGKCKKNKKWRLNIRSEWIEKIVWCSVAQRKNCICIAVWMYCVWVKSVENFPITSMYDVHCITLKCCVGV